MVTAVRTGFYFVCGGGSLCWSVRVCLLLVGREGGRGFYGRWVFMRVSKIAFGYTYILTPWCRVLLEKLTGLQLVKKFLAFHGTRKFITALTNVGHLSLSWASPIQSIYPHPTS